MAESLQWIAVSVACLLGLSACKDREPLPDPHSLSAMQAEGPPHSSDCRSWEKLDFTTLPALPEGPHVAAFDQVWRTLAQKHYDPTLACLDWPALREQFGKRVAEAGADATAAYAVINELLGLLGQSHLHATAPSSSSSNPARESGPAMVPISVRWLPLEPRSTQYAAVVVDEAVDAHPSGLPRGAVLTKIGDQAIAQIAREAEQSLGEGVGRPAETAFTVARAIDAWLSCPEGGRKRLSFLEYAKKDAERELEVECFLPEGERVSLGNLRNLPTRVSWRMLDEVGPTSDPVAPAGDPVAPPSNPAAPPSNPAAPPSNPAAPKIGYLAFNYWMLPMTERVRAGVDELRAAGMQALIIDLRGNPGGVGAMSIPIARMFLTEDASLGRLQMREFNQEFKIEGNPDAFTGPLAILIDEGTASTSEIFALGMRDIGRVVIVGGGPSAGMALPSMIETLPDGGLIQYVVGDYHSAQGTAAEGEGVVPERLVDESRVDYASGRDPVLDAAVDLLGERMR